ncbi:MAG TPA: hypothetical protein VGB37_12730 [Candidatus Lokiarchaeia archaeon]
MTLKTKGVIEEIQETNTYPKKDGIGNVFVTKLKINGRYYTCFYSPDEIKNLKEGQKIEITYTEKENEYQGKTYMNYNISSIQPSLEENIKEASANIVTINGKSYKLTFEEM